MNDVIDIFHKVLSGSRESGASDIHLCVGTPWKYRINGRITPLKNLPLLKGSDTETIAGHVVKMSRTLPENQVESFVTLLQDFDCAYSMPGVSRFRVNICRQRGTFSIVLRVVPFDPPALEQLDLPPVLGEIADEERGLVLVTGVTGSGKSTTLAAMLNRINHTRRAKIVTIEDPIEYLHSEVRSSVIQRELGSDTESFGKALRATLRQDPDVIMVGEMRDRVTMETAIKAAETGHLVLSTLHTLDAPRTIQRIVSVFELSEQKVVQARLAETLKAVVSQRLLRRADGRGRIAVFEIMRNTLSIRECIKDPDRVESIRDLIASGRSQYGMQTFDQHLMKLFKKGIISMEDAMAAASSADDFQRDSRFS